MLVRVIKRIFGGLFGIFGVGLIGFTGYEVIRYRVSFDLDAIVFGAIVMLCITLLSSGLLSWSFQDPAMKHRIMTGGMIPYFCFYSLILLSLLITSRHLIFSYLAQYGILERIRYTVNLVPFRTIIRYLTNADQYNASVLWENIGGNLILLLPMGFFLPLFFPKLRHFLAYTITLLIIDILIELFQLIFGIGTCDIDDILLNMIGGIAGFYLFRIPILQKLQRRMHYL